MSLRLSSGFCHGLQLETCSPATRPTAGRVRSAVWNALQEVLPEARVLDLCAGSGAVGIEALSRGARQATFVESNRDALRVLEKNLKAVKERAQKQGLPIATQVLGEDVAKALDRCAAASFDIIWIDPPYAIVRQLLPVLSGKLGRVASPSARLAIECAEEDQEFVIACLAPAAGLWQLDRQKVYGASAVTFFHRASQDFQREA